MRHLTLRRRPRVARYSAEERRRLNGTALAMGDAFARTARPWPLPPLTAHKATLEAFR